MIEVDDLDQDTLDAMGWHVVGREPLFPFDADAFMRAVAASSKREQRQRIAKALAVVRAAKRAGLSVRAATVEGVALEFGEAETNEAIDRRLRIVSKLG